MSVLPLPSSTRFPQDFALRNAFIEDAVMMLPKRLIRGSSNPVKQSEKEEEEEEEEEEEAVVAYSDDDNMLRLNRLVKIELDAAEALAEFSRLAQLRCQEAMPGISLQWSGKRRRSTRADVSSKNAYIGGHRSAGPGCIRADISDVKVSNVSEDGDMSKLSQNVAHTCVTKMARSLCKDPGSGSGSISDREDNDSVMDAQEHSFLDSRAESPSSPLPSLQVSCTRLPLRDGGPEAKSAFQRVLTSLAPPMHSSSVLQPKTKIEEIHCKSLAGRTSKVSARRKSKAHKPNTLSIWPPVKTEPLYELDMDIKDVHNQGYGLTEAAVKCLVSVASNVSEVSQEVGFGVVNKPKNLLTENEKDARRLRRIHANRESARQTIRRKQILCEELTKKASNLAAENENMKQKREKLMQDLYALKELNYQLKQQLGESSPGNLDLPTRIDSQPLSLPALKGQTSMMPFTGDSMEETCVERCVVNGEGEDSLPDQGPKDDSEIAPSVDPHKKDVGELPTQARDSSIHMPSTECYMVPPLYAYPYACNGDMAIKGSFPLHMYMGRKSYAAVLAAAQARKRRKEITLSKFPRPRAYRRQMK